jgi:hypothetical protein
MCPDTAIHSPPPADAAGSSASRLLPRDHEVRPEAAGAPVERTRSGCSETEGAPSSSSSPAAPSPCSSIQNPQSAIQNPAPLLLAVAACDATAPQIAARFNLTLEAYLDWLSTPETSRRLTALLAQGESVRLKRLETFHDSALETLHELHQKAEENADPVERRRSATAVARFSVFSRAQSSNISRLFRGLSITPAASPRARVHAGPAADVPDEAAFPNPKSAIQNPSSTRTIRPAFILHSATPITPPQPDPAHSPAQATTRLLQLLQNCDEPRRGHGLRALFNHFTPIWQGRVKANNADEFARAPIDAYRTLINHRSAVLHSTTFDDPPPWASDGPIRAHQSFDFVDIDGRNWPAKLQFSRSSGEPWLISAVELFRGPGHPPSGPAPSTHAQHAGNDARRNDPLTPADLAADAARLADLNRPRERPPPTAEDIDDEDDEDEEPVPPPEIAYPPARLSGY